MDLPLISRVPLSGLKSIPGVLAVALGPVLLSVFPGGLWNETPVPTGFGGAASLGEKIFTDYLFPFEMLSLLLLASVVGALVLAKRKL